MPKEAKSHLVVKNKAASFLSTRLNERSNPTGLLFFVRWRRHPLIESGSARPSAQQNPVRISARRASGSLLTSGEGEIYSPKAKFRKCVSQFATFAPQAVRNSGYISPDLNGREKYLRKFLYFSFLGAHRIGLHSPLVRRGELRSPADDQWSPLQSGGERANIR